MHQSIAPITAHPKPYAVKIPRDQMVRLEVEAEICPNVILRVLDILAHRSLIPFSIETARAEDGIRLAVEIEPLSGAELSMLTSKIAAIIFVRSARIRTRARLLVE
jgi:acetolactate synthase regulatory subunit